VGRRPNDPKLQAAKGKKPKGVDPLAPAPQPISLTPPKRLDKEKRALWIELAGKAIPQALVSEGDLQLFEVFVVLTHKMRNCQPHNGQQLISLTTRFLPTTPAIAQTAAPRPQTKLEEFLARKHAHDAAQAALPATNEQCRLQNEKCLRMTADLAAEREARGETAAEALERVMAENTARRKAK
jgi:hypothetical protein